MCSVLLAELCVPFEQHAVFLLSIERIVASELFLFMQDSNQVATNCESAIRKLRIGDSSTGRLGAT